MQDYDPVKSFLGEAAEQYDRHLRGHEDDAVAFLAGLAAGGARARARHRHRRIGLLLAAVGSPSRASTSRPTCCAAPQRRRRRPGDDRRLLGDRRRFGNYRLIYVVYNTFFNLLEQEQQVRCFENVAAYLADDGAFVIEAAVPAHINGLRENQDVDAEEVGVDEVWLDVAKYPPPLAAARGNACRSAPRAACACSRS